MFDDFALKCSKTIQASNVEKRSEVAIPARRRPINRTVKSGTNFVMQESEYITPKAIQRFLRPLNEFVFVGSNVSRGKRDNKYYLSAMEPIKVPNSMLEVNPAMNKSAMSFLLKL